MSKQTSTLLAKIWLLIVLAFIGHNIYLWSGHLQLDTDILAMLPQDERDPTVQNATRQLADAAANRVVVLAGGADWESAKKAGDAYATALTNSKLPLTLRYRMGDEAEWLSFFIPYRKQLLSSAQQQLLQSQSSDQLAQKAVAMLYQPGMGMPRLGEWRDDPLNLLGGWLGERAAQSKVRVRDGRLSISAGDRHYVLLTLQQSGSAFSIKAQQALIPVLDAAKAAALSQAGKVSILTVGIPLHAAAAATQAEREIHTIGIGSMLGIVLLTVFAFSAIRPRILVTLSIAVGLLAAVSVCSLVFGRLHLITLVFGASLVGVAENYGSNYFSSRQGRAASERWAMLKEQAPVMWLAMLTTAIGYALLALTPFPGLRQIAVFSAVGLLAAFVTVMWWFPLFDKGRLDHTKLSLWIGTRRALWPTLGKNRLTLIFTVIVSSLLLAGGMSMHSNDDIRLLQSSPPALIKQQIEVGKLLDLPSPAQFYLIRGASIEAVLQQEEALKARLDPMMTRGRITGYQAISDWVPSHKQQDLNLALTERTVFAKEGVLAKAGILLGETLQPSHNTPPPLLLNDWLAAAVSEPLRHQWLGQFEGGYASVMLIRGVSSASQLTELAALAPQLTGVRWVDKVAEVSEVMGRYRVKMAWVIALSYLLVFAALTLRFGRKAWRALLPTLLASSLTLAILALLGQPLQLFNILALLLILGMGVDYGIFLLENPEPQATRPFLSVTLAAISTLLAFGLLALSATPALHAFGLTMLFGIGLSWLLTPAFMPLTSFIQDR
ncbi:MMPL family transporter [Iodobacter sp. CM08]|uniref:MMPL family transporter n=1 Tax=Iodobacter sp. CM08 TaxID=3085902 RepID=UPI002981591B|nr:MMPL family transporter [Iodobacter sp. CM08]MDW5416443.1 MMPL family transporter [Iodobacter sp. CM08]